MLSMILSLMGGGLGALLRFVPEIFKLITDSRDRDHEYRMTQLQLEIDKARAGQQIDLVHAQGDVSIASGEMQAYVEAIKGQAQLTGVRFIDALNASVRPFLTYWWMVIFTAYKVMTVMTALQGGATFSQIGAVLWTADDWGVLSMILGFWFVDRSLRKIHGR